MALLSTSQVLPVVIFLSSVVSVLFYWGVMQYVIRKMAWVMQFTMATTAAESLNAAANIFLGMVCDATGFCYVVVVGAAISSSNILNSSLSSH